MPDVTFGVKVPEEMKNELSDLMKDTTLTGKEFMSLLLSSYKLEKNKRSETFTSSEIEELQRLLQRIQNLYLNINERTNLVVASELQLKEDEIKKIKATEDALKEEIKKLTEIIEENKVVIKEERENVRGKMKVIEKLEQTLKETNQQFQQARTLNEQYEINSSGLKTRILELEQFEVEIDTYKEELQKMQSKNDELASDFWFLQRENEHLKNEQTRLVAQHEQQIATLKAQYDLELKNSLLEQKLSFNAKIDLLKEAHYTQLQSQSNQFQELIVGKTHTRKEES